MMRLISLWELHSAMDRSGGNASELQSVGGKLMRVWELLSGPIGNPECTHGVRLCSPYIRHCSQLAKTTILRLSCVLLVTILLMLSMFGTKMVRKRLCVARIGIE